jgi:hypothetical protein
VALQLRLPGQLRVTGPVGPRDGIYVRRDGAWLYLASASDQVSLSRLGRYGVLTDDTPPTVRILALPSPLTPVLAAEVSDAGSGLDESSVTVLVDGAVIAAPFADGRISWVAPASLAGGRHAIQVITADRAGNESAVTVEFSTGAASSVPQRLALGANYPNPFNPGTSIPVSIPLPGVHEGGGAVSEGADLVIYNQLGQRVRVLGRNLLPGRHTISWDGLDDAGRRAGSGLYLYRLEGASAVVTRRMTLLK